MRFIGSVIEKLQRHPKRVVFPEGTFKEDAPGLLAFRDGAFLMAAHAGVPVVPGVIRGSRRLYGSGHPLMRWSAVTIEFFAPLAPSGDHRHAAESLRDSARQVVLAHCGEPDRSSVASVDD